MELKTVRDAFDRVTKKQKLCYSKTQEVVDRLSQEIDKALNTIQEAPSGSSDDDEPLHHKSLVAALKKTFKEIAPTKQVEATQKELSGALNKYPKALDKTLNPDITTAYRNVEFDRHALHQVIAGFFYRQGMFDIGDSFISESGEPEPDSSATKPFMEMHRILEAMRKRDLGPALKWVAANSDKLELAKSDLELKLHSLHFLEIAQDKDTKEAINYARKHITAYSDRCFPEIQKLMGSLLWNRNLDKSPYAEFLSPALWTNAAKDLTQQYCNLLGESSESPLVVTLAAGSEVLPTFLKYLNLLPEKRKEWQTMEQLLVPVKLPEEYRFHSVFVCPVSKEHSSEDNPPMRMSCGHVISNQTINRMSRNGAKSFKCPYCPTEVDPSQCKQLYF
ncbi:PREDICTED: protein RMD5 homolog A-like [Camelina sativa]|uniref:Protein RMD5 homolog A-like n=1 Tax=Camelina sativa TaxID=90675 RepID=A0ABM0SW84_CAMSA|nr:PREDICTED: protein RMD5 homolog A-like [Camelina sativa]XP_010417028.1 PREDICTED: protein RMD5 homolog A-like [Camelina sativa]